MIGHILAKMRPRSGRVGPAALAGIVLLAAGRGIAQTPPASGPAAGAGAPPAEPPASIRRAIGELGSPSYTVRENASQRLWQAGIAAQPALERLAAESDDFEAVYRARQVLAAFHLGIYPDTPPETAELITRFNLGSFGAKLQIVQELRNAGKRDLLRRLLEREPDRQVREQLVRYLPMFGRASATTATETQAEPDAGDQARTMVARRDFDAAERLLRDAAGLPLLRDYAALLLARNKLPAEIAKLRGRAKPGDSAAQRRLCWYLRVNGDLPGAIAAARSQGDRAMRDALLMDSCDWKQLAKGDSQVPIGTLAGLPTGPGRVARVIAFRYLAGDRAACEAAIAAAVAAVKTNKLDPQFLIGPLVLSDHVDACVELLAPAAPAAAFEVLAGQDRLNDAFRLAKVDLRPAKTDWPSWLKAGANRASPERIALGESVAKALREVGEDDRGQELLSAVAGEILASHPASLGPGLIETSAELGRPERTDALAARLIAKDAESTEDVLRAIYAEKAEAAAMLWEERRGEFPDEGQLSTLRAIRRMLTAKPDAAMLAELRQLATRVSRMPLLAAARNAANVEEVREYRARRLLALAAVFHRCGDVAMALRCLRLTSTFGLAARTLVESGNALVGHKDWARARQAYEAAWNRDPKCAEALYSLGWVQVKQGNEKEGRANMEAALTVPLGDGDSRLELVRALVRLRENDEAARQRQLLLRTADPSDRSLAQTLREIGAAEPPSGGAAAVQALERTMALVAGGGLTMSSPHSYLTMSCSLHRARAHALLDQGRTAEAVQELHRAEAVAPVSVQLALDFDAALRKQGAAAEADALYRRVADRLLADGRDFPRCAGCRNDLAWLAANLNRDLDMALSNAQRAVELAPQSAGFLDTLAEVQFRRGSRAEAVRLARRCVELDGGTTHYKDRLARFEK
jgi:tetratricopeptide (TPR) repeat protein